MRLSSEAVGRVFAEIDVAAERRATMAYAAGLGAERPLYLDDLAPGGIAAPPAFCVSPEWRLLTDRRYFAAIGLSPSDIWRGVHVEQDTLFHRLVRPPETLRVVGRLLSMRPTRAGALVTLSIAIADKASGEPVSETLWTAIYRGVECDPAGESQPSAQAAPEPNAADPSSPIRIARWLPHVYTECADIWNPIHTERSYAARLGLPTILLHGTATWALVAETLIDRHGDSDPARLRRLRCRFTAPVWPGTTLSVASRAAGTDNRLRVGFHAISDDGRKVVSDGVAEFAAPG